MSIPLSVFPTEILRNIFYQLSPEERLPLRVVNHRFRAITDDMFRKHIVVERLGDSLTQSQRQSMRMARLVCTLFVSGRAPEFWKTRYEWSHPWRYLNGDCYLLSQLLQPFQVLETLQITELIVNDWQRLQRTIMNILSSSSRLKKLTIEVSPGLKFLGTDFVPILSKLESYPSFPAEVSNIAQLDRLTLGWYEKRDYDGMWGVYDAFAAIAFFRLLKSLEPSFTQVTMLEWRPMKTPEIDVPSYWVPRDRCFDLYDPTNFPQLKELHLVGNNLNSYLRAPIMNVNLDGLEVIHVRNFRLFPPLHDLRNLGNIVAGLHFNVLYLDLGMSLIYKAHDGLARVIDEWLDLIQREEFSSYYGSHRLFGRIDTIIWNLKLFVNPQQILPADAALPWPDVANRTIKFYFGGVNTPKTFSKNLWNSDTVNSARFVDDAGEVREALSEKNIGQPFTDMFRPLPVAQWRFVKKSEDDEPDWAH